jgi:hypothetical protein
MKLKQAKPMYVFIITGIRVYIPTVTKSITRVIAGQRADSCEWVCKFRPNGAKTQLFKFTKLIIYFKFFQLKKNQFRSFLEKKVHDFFAEKSFDLR